MEQADGLMSRLAGEARAGVVAGLAGATAGVLVAGIGGRVAMRISMLIAAGTVEGRLTEGGNRIGEFTVDGSISLILFGGLLTGLIGGIVWFTIRPYVRRSGRLELPLVVVAALALVGFQIVDPGNRDFVVLQPPGRQVALFLVLVALTGLATAWFDRVYERTLPRATRWALAYLPAVMIGTILLIPTFATMVNETFCFCEEPPVVSGYLLMATFSATVLAAGWRIVAGHEPPRWLMPTGSVLMAAATSAGLIHLGRLVADTI